MRNTLTANRAYCRRWNLPPLCSCGVPFEWRRGRKTAHRRHCSIARAVAATLAHFKSATR
jgi:hypothetical protein